MNLNNLNQKKEILRNFIIIFSTLCFIFLSGIKYEFFQLRFVILALFFISLFKFYDECRLKNFQLFLNFFLFLFLILSNLFFNLDDKNFLISNYTIFGYLFFLIIFFTSYFYTSEINKHIPTLVFLFYVCLIVSSILGIFFIGKPQSTIFCGGIPVYFEFLNKNFYFPFNYISEIYSNEGPNGISKLSSMKLTFDEYIFDENSHLGMVAPGCIIFSLYQLSKKNTGYIFNVLFFIFLLICILKSSTTLIIGTIASLVFITVFNYKHFSKSLILLFIGIIVVFSNIIYFSKECNSRLIPLYYDNNEIVTNKKTLNRKEHKDKQSEILVPIGLEKKYAFIISEIFSKDNFIQGGSLSSAVYFNSLSVAYKSILNKPLGWGINGYENAFKIYGSKINNLNKNSKDASNNFAKIIVEFGVIGILFYFFLLFINSSKYLPIDYKLFYIPMIITQSIRGAGYFNSGFILIVFLLIFSYIKFHKLNK